MLGLSSEVAPRNRVTKLGLPLGLGLGSGLRINRGRQAFSVLFRTVRKIQVKLEGQLDALENQNHYLQTS